LNDKEILTKMKDAPVLPQGEIFGVDVRQGEGGSRKENKILVRWGFCPTNGEKKVGRTEIRPLKQSENPRKRVNVRGRKILHPPKPKKKGLPGVVGGGGGAVSNRVVKHPQKNPSNEGGPLGTGD